MNSEKELDRVQKALFGAARMVKKGELTDAMAELDFCRERLRHLMILRGDEFLRMTLDEPAEVTR